MQLACAAAMQPLSVVLDCRAMDMPQPPPALLPVPASMPPVPANVHSLQLSELGLVSGAEQLSNQHMHDTVGLEDVLSA